MVVTFLAIWMSILLTAVSIGRILSSYFSLRAPTEQNDFGDDFFPAQGKLTLDEGFSHP
jgi:hypothetical protein